jgi:hypothetical protein
LQNVHVIDFEGVGGGYRPGLGALTDSLGKDLAALRLQLLAVVQPTDRLFRIQDHSSGENRAEQGTAAGFIQPRDGPVSSAPESPLMTAGRHTISP